MTFKAYVTASGSFVFFLSLFKGPLKVFCSELRRPLFGAWTWQNDLIALLVLGVIFTLFYAPTLLLAWIIIFLVAFVIGHLVWLNIKITLDKELTAKLTEEAKTRGMTFRQAVEELIRKHLKKEE